MRIIFSIFILLLGLSSCKSYQPEVSKLADEVMVIHDEIMPEMSTIHKLRKKIKKRLKDGQLAPEKIQNYKNSLTELENADEAMMVWMQEYEIPDAAVEKQISYLNKEENKIKEVKIMMESAIKNAQNVVNEF